jgi:hypothetical protein
MKSDLLVTSHPWEMNSPPPTSPTLVPFVRESRIRIPAFVTVNVLGGENGPAMRRSFSARARQK